VAISLAALASAGTTDVVPAYLVTRLELASSYPLSVVQLRDADSGERYNIRYDPRNTHRVLAVRPGHYYVSRIVTRLVDVLPATFKQPGRLAEIRAGQISYIGDIVVESPEYSPPMAWNAASAETTVIASSRRDGDIRFRPTYQHRFVPETIASALRDQQDLPAGIPWRIAIPGLPSRPITATGIVSDLGLKNDDPDAAQAGLHQLPGRAWWLRLTRSGQVRTCAITPSGISMQIGAVQPDGVVAWSSDAPRDRVTVRPDGITAAGPTTEFRLASTRDAPDLPCIAELYAP
jgi:hypothetical protein